jgi:hypothetical protein
LTYHSKEIWDLENLGVKPMQIASSLCAKHKLPKNALTGKQVSNWIAYQKKSGKHSTRKVSLENKNLRPGNCKFETLFYF